MTRPEPVPPLPLDEAALTMARRFKLIRPDGTAKCINGLCDRNATLPTLECDICIDHRLKGYR